MNIKVLSGNINMYLESPQIHVANFGTLKENTPAKFTILVEGVDSSELVPTCGCTATASTEKNTYTVEYRDTHHIAPFSKVIVLNYVEDGKKKVANIKMTGNVIK